MDMGGGKAAPVAAQVASTGPDCRGCTPACPSGILVRTDSGLASGWRIDMEGTPSVQKYNHFYSLLWLAHRTNRILFSPPSLPFSTGDSGRLAVADRACDAIDLEGNRQQQAKLAAPWIWQAAAAGDWRWQAELVALWTSNDGQSLWHHGSGERQQWAEHAVPHCHGPLAVGDQHMRRG
ncbi:hypothetical protein GUJ93_ZPchr0010g8785 [Zizania palustris]|uniref:Uncharacterized protein n=1 Tax=Zizania palustris TaxID=103762 RepID=A0A8J5WEP3_ZIZPA|nr:hypothetical protein GUJ93_ZPchr0010g8785 [Zizania palustris]